MKSRRAQEQKVRYVCFCCGKKVGIEKEEGVEKKSEFKKNCGKFVFVVLGRCFGRCRRKVITTKNFRYLKWRY